MFQNRRRRPPIFNGQKPDKALEKEDYKAFYNYINDPNNICELYNYFLTYDNSKYETGVDTLKKVVEQEKFKKYANVVDGKTHRIVDSAPYLDSWFRLPYQT